jgi:hypothetical protein
MMFAVNEFLYVGIKSEANELAPPLAAEPGHQSIV